MATVRSSASASSNEFVTRGHGRRWRRSSLSPLEALCLQASMSKTIGVSSSLALPSRISELAMEQVRSGPASRLVLVGIDGAPSTDVARLSRLLVETLSKSSNFSRVSNGANELDESALQTLFKDRYLLGPDTGRDEFTPEELRRSIASALGRLGSLSGYALGDLLPADPTGRSQALIKAWQGSSQPHYKHGVWFSRDEAMALMLVATVAQRRRPARPGSCAAGNRSELLRHRRRQWCDNW